MIMEPQAAALAENAIEIRYKGKYDYAACFIDDDGGANASPLISLGVSNTDLAAAVTAMQTVVTGSATMDIHEVIATINNFYDTTAARKVLAGEWEARQFNSLLNDTVYAASTALFEDDDGTTNNYKKGWYGILTWDNNATGVGMVTLRVPQEAEFNSLIAISEISGLTGATGTPTITRAIYNKEGTSLWTNGGVASATAALLKQTFPEPVKFGSPVYVRDTAANVAHLTATTMFVVYAHVPAKDN